MNRYLIFLTLFAFTACTTQVKNHPDQDTATAETDSSKIEVPYQLIRDNLYVDESGGLYLKAVNNEDFDQEGNLHPKTVWLTTVYCDSCWTPTKEGWEDITELKDFVDTATFHLDTTENEQGADIYADKNHRFFHKWMADGGTITLIGKIEAHEDSTFR